ncbi:phosphoribosylanthranilate isomerase [Deferribacter autotrophicus]|uniref:N-(5'-phosphoribosyl)anthranilate isomerase n=1 Tax=Deferribacter autotrophicus TaxID=500465 RepID=A0A5A8EZX5_9BACT|nr:phosphoribosylanthranilate isomerase [Deferribacter autotrophicus]KAA0257092.1 phosphoribosylanthranilate isomerase [Deferribacter autotrophicus]
MFVKVCGITDFCQIDWAVELGFSAIGVVLYPKSKRYVTSDFAKKLSSYAKGKILTVCVSLTYDDMKDCANFFDYVQIYEYRKVKGLIYASSAEPAHRDYEYFMFDASMGKGIFDEDIPDWIYNYREKLIFSGGLDENNVRSVIERIKPFGVDVSSSVEESPGIKSYDKMKRFIEACKNAMTEK